MLYQVGNGRGLFRSLIFGIGKSSTEGSDISQNVALFGRFRTLCTNKLHYFFSDSIPSLTISDPSIEDLPMPKIEDLNKPPPLPDTTNVQKIVIDVKAKSEEILTISTSNNQVVKKKSREKAISEQKKVKREIALVMEPTPKKCLGFVGFANLPNQVYK